MSTRSKRIHVIINPASGKDQPMVNIINDMPDDLQAAVELMCTSAKLRYVDAVKQGVQSPCYSGENDVGFRPLFRK